MQKRVIEYANETFTETTYMEISVIVDSNGYYQASKICKDNNKEFKYWKRLERTVEILNKYSELLKFPIEGRGEDFTRRPIRCLLYKRSGKYHQFQGWYIHFKLVNDLCMWCDIDYAIKVNEIIDMYNEELHLRNITLEDKMKEMNNELEKYRNEIQNKDNTIKALSTIINDKSVKTNIDTRKLRIYDIKEYREDEEPLNPFHKNCIWWISADNKRRYLNYRLLLEVEVVSSMHGRMDVKSHYNENKVNGKLNTVKQNCKMKMYNFIMKTLIPKHEYVNEIEDYIN